MGEKNTEMGIARIWGVILAVTPFYLGGQSVPERPQIRWVDWNDAYVRAEKEQKVLMVHLYTDWCGWCKRMQRSTFTDPRVVALINKEIIPVKINPERPGKYKVDGGREVDGRTLVRMLSNNQRSGYPTHFFLVPRTRQIFREPGYRAPDAFLQTLQRYISLNKGGSAPSSTP